MKDAGSERPCPVRARRLGFNVYKTREETRNDHRRTSRKKSATSKPSTTFLAGNVRDGHRVLIGLTGLPLPVMKGREFYVRSTWPRTNRREGARNPGAMLLSQHTEFGLYLISLQCPSKQSNRF